MAKTLEKPRPAAKRKAEADDDDEAPSDEAPKKRGKLKLIIIIVVALIVVLGGGGGAYMFLFAGSSDKGPPKEAPPPAPFFVKIEPFVVTMTSTDGSMHYVQLALSLKVPGEEAVAAATTVMPELLDMMRQQVLGFKVDDLQTQAGVEKLRGVMLVQSNRVLRNALGKDKIAALGAKNGALVGNIFFQNLVIE